MLIPQWAARAILPWGTTTVCTDPHEIANVAGRQGVAFMLDLSLIHILGVPLVGIAALVLHWPVYMCYLCTVMEEVIKMLVGLPRFRSGKWMNDLNQHAEAEA